MKIQTHLAVFASVAGLVVEVSGQVDSTSARIARIAYHRLVVPQNSEGIVAEHLFVDSNDSTSNCVLRWRLFTTASTPIPDSTKELPFQRIGNILTLVPSTSYLIGGWKLDGTGVITRITLTRATTKIITVNETKQYTGLDFWDLLWIGNSDLFAVDYTGKQLIRASWNGVAALPATFSPVFDSTIVKELDSPWETVLTDGASVSVPGVLISVGKTVPTRKVYKDTGGAWVQSELDPLVLADGYDLKHQAAVPSAGPLKIAGPVGSFSVVDLATSQTVATGQINIANETVSVALAQELLPGNPHQIVGTGGTILSSVFRPLVVYGKPTPELDQLRITNGVMPIADHHVNGSRFGVAAGFHRSNAPVLDETVPVAVFVAMRNSDGTDPVTVVGEQAFITPLIRLDSSVTVNKDHPSRAFAQPLPIPDDANLAGVVFLYQLAALTVNNNLIVTEVFASAVLPSPPLPAAASSTTAKITPSIARSSRRGTTVPFRARSLSKKNIAKSRAWIWLRRIGTPCVSSSKRKIQDRMKAWLLETRRRILSKNKK